MLVSDPKSEPHTIPPTVGTWVDRPPPYAADELPASEVPDPPAGPSIHTPTIPSVPAPKIQPCNHLLLSEKDTALRGSYVLDVGLPAPPFAASLPGFKQLGDANLRFEVRDGSIAPEIWVAARKEKASPETRARIAAKIRDGMTNIVLHSPRPSMPRPLISLSVEIRDGRSTIAIPRSFRGHLSLKKRHCTTALSPGIQTLASLIYSADGKQVYCIGERDLVLERADEISFEGRDGNVSVMFSDERLEHSTGRK